MLTDKTAQARLETALKNLWERSRFTSYFYQTVDLLEETDVPTIALTVHRSRLVLHYAGHFIRHRTVEELIGLLVHEMLHVMMNHHHRAFPDEDIYLQNLAQDMVINSFITNNAQTFFSRKGQYSDDIATLQLPAGLPLIPPAFFEETGQADPPWETLYRWLARLPQQTLDEIKSRSEIKDTKSGIPLSEEEAAMHHLNEVLQNPLNIPAEYRSDASFVTLGEQRGLVFKDSEGRDLPTGVHMMMRQSDFQQRNAKKQGIIRFASGDSRCSEERALQQIRGIISEVRKQNTAPWARKIKSLVDFSSQSGEWKYTHGRFNRRYFAQGIYAAGRVFEDKGRITVAVDVSGSVVTQPEMLETAFGVVDDLAQKYTTHLVCIDEQLFVPEKSNDGWIRSRSTDRPYLYQRGDWKYIRTGSMGTTFFSPLFNDYLKNHREMLLVITDGQIYDLEQLKPYRHTLWVVPEEKAHRFAPPFGQVVTFGIQT